MKRIVTLIALFGLPIAASTISVPLTGSGTYIWSPVGWQTQLSFSGNNGIDSVFVNVTESTDNDAGSMVWSDQLLPYTFITLPLAQGSGTIDAIFGEDWLPPNFGLELTYSIGGGPGFVAIRNHSGQSALVNVDGIARYTSETEYRNSSGVTSQVIADFVIEPSDPAPEPAPIVTCLLALAALVTRQAMRA